jgi:hypothetical protein
MGLRRVQGELLGVLGVPLVGEYADSLRRRSIDWKSQDKRLGEKLRGRKGDIIRGRPLRKVNELASR